METALREEIAKQFLVPLKDVTYNGRLWYVTFFDKFREYTITHILCSEVVKRIRESLTHAI